MKYTFTFTLLLTLLASITWAQPTITANPTMVLLGESAEIQFALGNTDPGSSGANVSWDFSGIQDDALAFNWTAETPVGTAFQDSFPGATMAFHSFSQDGNAELWHYYDFDATAETFEYLGSVDLINDGVGGQDTVHHLLYANPKKVLEFPFTYNDTYTDAFGGVNHINVNGFDLEQTRTGSITVTADGYGTLQTPAGSYQNVLRVHIMETLTDHFMGFPTTSQTIHRWSWYAENEKYLLMHIDSIRVEPVNGPVSVTTSMFYRTATATQLLPERELEELDLVCAPNPAQDQLHVQWNDQPGEATHLTISDLNGRVLQQITPGIGGRAEVSLAGVSPGVYLVQLRTETALSTRKIIVQ